MRYLLYMMLTALVLLAVFFWVAMSKAETTRQDLRNNQLQADGLSADKKSYNTSPYAAPNDGYNQWLNSQSERTQKERNQIIERDLQNRDRIRYEGRNCK